MRGVSIIRAMLEAGALVVGCGVMGAATAWHLSRRGIRCVVLEQFGVGHHRGSSHGTVRIFRLSYADPHYVQLGLDAIPLWRTLEAESGRELLITAGAVDFGGDLGSRVAALQACDARHELMAGAEAMRRHPGLALDPNVPVVFQPDGAVVMADRTVRACIDLAVAAGAELHEHSRVIEIGADGDRAVVRTAKEVFVAPVAVVTAGPWAGSLLATAGIDVPVVPTREAVTYFRHPEGMRLPTVLDWGEPVVGSLPDPGRGIKVTAHGIGPPSDPDEEVAEPAPSTIRMLAEWVRRHHPHADPEPYETGTCFFTSTDDDRFILERHGPIVVGSPCSGHGFKFAPLIGQRLADLAMS
jgi:sarcosine oxidase